MKLNEIVETDIAPIHCAACYAQQPGLRHVDFDSAADRGYADGIPVDDIIVCENCVRRAGELVGMVPEESQHREIVCLTLELSAERKARKQAQNYAERLESAFDARPQKVAVDHRQKPRKVIA